MAARRTRPPRLLRPRQAVEQRRLRTRRASAELAVGGGNQLRTHGLVAEARRERGCAERARLEAERLSSCSACVCTVRRLVRARTREDKSEGELREAERRCACKRSEDALGPCSNGVMPYSRGVLAHAVGAAHPSGVAGSQMSFFSSACRHRPFLSLQRTTRGTCWRTHEACLTAQSCMYVWQRRRGPWVVLARAERRGRAYKLRGPFSEQLHERWSPRSGSAGGLTAAHGA